MNKTEKQGVGADRIQWIKNRMTAHPQSLNPVPTKCSTNNLQHELTQGQIPQGLLQTIKIQRF